MQMHDELGISAAGPDRVREVGEIMIAAHPLVVPIKVDLEVGPTWGKAKTNYLEYDWSTAA